MNEMKDKIGMNTCFAYIYLHTDPAGGIGLYAYDDDPQKMLLILTWYYAVMLAETLGLGIEENLEEMGDLSAVFGRITQAGHSDALQPLNDVIGAMSDHPDAEELRTFDQKFRVLVEALDGAMDYSLCFNLVEFLQFLRQYQPEISVGEVFDELFGGAELDCDPIA